MPASTMAVLASPASGRVSSADHAGSLVQIHSLSRTPAAHLVALVYLSAALAAAAVIMELGVIAVLQQVGVLFNPCGCR